MMEISGASLSADIFLQKYLHVVCSDNNKSFELCHEMAILLTE